MSHICFVAGKSGGHIIPCLTLAKKYIPDYITFISTNTLLDQSLTSQPFITKNIYINLDNVPYKKLHRYPLFLGQLIWSTLKILIFFMRQRPQKIISTGSYIAIPVVLVGFVLRIPIELWELNVIPGKAVKLLAMFAQKINICFSETKNYLPSNKCHDTGYPISYEENDKYSSLLGREKLSLQPDRKTIFILGGSQGSHELNFLMKEIFKHDQFLTKKIQIIHQTGSDDPDKIQEWYGKKNIPAHVFSYKNNLAAMYNAADLIISRAGAGALAEIAFFNKDAVIIPLKTKQTDHQWHNAQSLAKKFPQQFIVLEATETDKLAEKLKNI